MAKKQTTTWKRTSSNRIIMEESGPSIFAVAHYVHNTIARHCEYCGSAMSPSDVNDYGSLCESCYMKEYYNDRDYEYRQIHLFKDSS